MTRQTQKEFAIQILKDSAKIDMASKEVDETIEVFLASIDGCTWADHEDDREKRQFETSLKGHFEEFNREMYKYHKENPSTIFGKTRPFEDVNLHTMDDQGFEGQILANGSFYRWISDMEIDVK